MRKKFKIEVLTPFGKFYEDEVEFISFTAIGGEFGVLADHAATLVANKPCPMTIEKDNEKKYMYIADGFVQISNNLVSVIVDYAEWSSNIDASKVLRDIKNAEEKLESKKHDEAERTELLAGIEKARAAVKTSSMRN